MIRSPVYEFIKEEGIKEGIKEGMQQSLIDILEEKFEIVPANLVKSISKVEDTRVLKMLNHHVIKSNSIDEFAEKMKKIIDS